MGLNTPTNLKKIEFELIYNLNTKMGEYVYKLLCTYILYAANRFYIF